MRAVPLDYLKKIIGFANERQLVTHMHVAEQQAEVSAVLRSMQVAVALLELRACSASDSPPSMRSCNPKAIGMLADAGATGCACPTTERNLWDGIIPVDEYSNEACKSRSGLTATLRSIYSKMRASWNTPRLQRMERALLAPSRSVGLSETA